MAGLHHQIRALDNLDYRSWLSENWIVSVGIRERIGGTIPDHGSLHSGIVLDMRSAKPTAAPESFGDGLGMKASLCWMIGDN